MFRANVVGSFSIGRNTAAIGTAFTRLIPPFSGAPGNAPRLFKVDAGRKMANDTQTALTGFPNWWSENDAFTHITDLNTINSGTSHQCRIMRPLNWTYVTEDAAVNQAVIKISEDPGVYSTNYRYPSLSSKGTAQVADNAIAASDYCVYQLNDGTWVLDTVSSVSGLSITMTTVVPNITGGGVLKNSPFFFFGIQTDKDPATGLAHLDFDTTVSTTQHLQTQIGSLWHSLHRGDSMIFYNPNTTAADTLAGIWGVYTKDW